MYRYKWLVYDRISMISLVHYFAGGGATGHPAQFIRLKAGEEVTCNYCSLRYKYAEADDPAGPPKWAADP